VKEKDWLAQVRQLARLHGWRVFHAYDPILTDPGFPDLVLVRERVIFAELKGPRGRVSERQWEWIDALMAAGAEVYIWHPDDIDEVIETLREHRPTARKITRRNG
jgi:spermidine/putrescine-binding protein